MFGWKSNRPSSYWALSAVSLLCALSSCKKPAEAQLAAPILRVSQRNEPATLDPQRATLPDEFFIIRALGEGLLTPSPDDGEPQPAVATKWTISPDGRTYTFTLNPEARWSNGTPIVAADFVASLERALTPATAAPKAALFFPLKNAEAFYAGREKDFSAVGVRALPDGQLELTLTEPQADFLALVASGPWIPVHRSRLRPPLADGPNRAGGISRDNYIGNGPFTLDAWRPHQAIVVARNPTYRAARLIPLAAIHFLAFDSGDSEERAFRAGQLDVTMSVPFHKLPAYRASQPPILRSVPQQETRYLAINTTKSPLNDRRVRQALALALNRRTLTEKVLQGGQVPAYSFIPPGLGQHTSGLALEEDLTEARRLLTAAGFPQGRGFPRLELTTWHPAPVLEVIQQVWRRELGLEITLAQREARTHLAALAAGDYDLALVTAIPDYPSAADLFTQLTSGHPANYPHWRNAEYDDLVRAANTQASPALRHRHYALAEKILLEDMPLIPLYFNVQNFLIQPNVKNWRTDSLWTRFFSGLTRE